MLAAVIPLGVLAITACSSSDSSNPTAVSTVTSVTASTGNLQVATVGTTLPDSLAVLVTNSSGVGVANVTVSWTPNTAGGTPSSNQVGTNSSGIAKIAWTIGTAPGTDSMTAAINGISYIFTATATIGSPAQITVVNYSSVTEAPSSTLPTLSVKVGDHYGNPVPNVTVTWSVTAGGGSLASATTTTNANGLATNTWTLGSVGGGTVNTVSATLTGSGGAITPATFTAMAGVQLVAEAVVDTLPGGFGWPILYVGIQGQSVPVLLDLGALDNSMTSTLVGSSGGSVNTQIGTVTRSLSFQSRTSSAAGGLALGVLAAPTLSQFDWVENGPKDSISLYAQPSPPTSQPVWLPSGITVADCIPIQSDPYNRVLFTAQVDGVSMRSIFDSGARRTNMNLAALTALGFDTLTSPNVHPVSFGATVGNDPARWEVTGIRVTVGTHTLAVDSATVYQDLPYEPTNTTATLGLGTISFIDRTIVVSYSSQHFCVGQP